ncbi:MAG: 7-carboxy-7-deazaguanine synthase QueE [Rickettsiales bacterium]
MFGKNPKRGPETGDGQTLQVVNIFPTLQGEGPFAGHPAVFIRLGGCNLACSFCDTEFEQFEAMTLDAVLAQVTKLSGCTPSPEITGGDFDLSQGRGLPVAQHTETSPLGEVEKRPSRFSGEGVQRQFIRDLVVITGGEPLRQNIAPLCEALLAAGLRVQIETNGTLWRELPKAAHVVCSPKVTDGRYHTLRPDILARVDALKFIISADDAEYADVGQVGQVGTNIPVYVQPMDSYDHTRNAANLVRAAALAQTHGYRLSLQVHKLLGIA